MTTPGKPSPFKPSPVKPFVYLTRKINFSAAHCLNSKHLTEEENKKMYGKCNRTHGHNYVVKVTVRGHIDSKYGFFMNVGQLKEYMIQAIEDVLDHRNLDVDIAYFKENITTMENITVFVWNNLKNIMEKPDLLYEVKVKESDNNSAFYRGD